jgi:geranylgeranyl diphosphate synthase type I
MLEEVAEKEYMAMIAKKTAYLFKTAAEIGATVGGGSKTEVRRLGEFAYNSGIAFQIVDDILGLTGDEEKLGKPVGSDLREGKKTLPIIHALKRATSTQKHIILKAMRQSSTQSNILKAKDIIVKLGSIDYAIRKSKEYAQRGIRQLDSFQDNSAKNALVSYTSFLVDRQF